MTQTILVIITGLLMLPGLMGAIFPILPGVPFMFVVAVAYGFLTQFNILTGIELGYLGALAIISVLVDYFAGILGAKFGGASGKSLLIGLAGFLIGTALLPPLGGLVGMFVGIAASEIYWFKKTTTALRAAGGGVLGSLAGIMINLIVGIAFIICFLVFTL